MPATTETVELLDAQIKGQKKLPGKWHPEKPVITFYPGTTYRLHPACYDPTKFDLVKPGTPPAAPAAPTRAALTKTSAPGMPTPDAPKPLSKELGGGDAAPYRPPVAQRPTEEEWRAAGYKEDPWPAHEAAMKRAQELATSEPTDPADDGEGEAEDDDDTAASADGDEKPKPPKKGAKGKKGGKKDGDA